MQTYVNKSKNKVIFENGEDYLFTELDDQKGGRLDGLAEDTFKDPIAMAILDTSLEGVSSKVGDKEEWVPVDSFAAYLEGLTS